MPGGDDADIPDPLIWLAWVAARTDDASSSAPAS